MAKKRRKMQWWRDVEKNEDKNDAKEMATLKRQQFDGNRGMFTKCVLQWVHDKKRRRKTGDDQTENPSDEEKAKTVQFQR